MSILIKGIEIPDKHNYVDCRIWKDGTVCLLYGAYSSTTPYKAILIPPHGRLGDLDELKECLKKPVTMDANRAEYLWEGWHECTIRVEQIIEALPTIIPADKEVRSDG